MFHFDDLPDGQWKIEITMLCFQTIDADVTICDVDDPMALRAETCGYPHPGCEVKIIDPSTGSVVAPGVVGEPAIVYHGEPVVIDRPGGMSAAVQIPPWPG